MEGGGGVKKILQWLTCVSSSASSFQSRTLFRMSSRAKLLTMPLNKSIAPDSPLFFFFFVCCCLWLFIFVCFLGVGGLEGLLNVPATVKVCHRDATALTILSCCHTEIKVADQNRSVSHPFTVH